MVITMVLERESAVIAQRKCEFSGVITALLLCKQADIILLFLSLLDNQAVIF